MWRSWLAHYVRDVGVVRSSRIIPTKQKQKQKQKKGSKSDMNPESETKNFRGYVMRKKHSYEDRLKYMKMLEAGSSVH